MPRVIGRRMTADEHAAEAERLLGVPVVDALARAQVHATLALYKKDS